jgi:hypothetical protein
MSAFEPQTRKTGNVPHLSHILRKPQDLGMELKDTACAKLLIMLAIELQRSRHDRTMTEFYAETGKQHSACTLRLMKESSTKLYPTDDENMNPNATDLIHIADAWFGSIATAVGARKYLGEEKVKVVMNVKTNHSNFPKKYLEDTMANWPSGSHLLLKATVENECLYAIGYKYCKSKTLCFIFNEGVSGTYPGKPYVAKWKDDNNNTKLREVPRPEVCSLYFRHSNVIDVHNQMRQKELRLEKFWVTNCGYFRLLTTVFGITIVDCWRAYCHHLNDSHRHKNIELLKFVDMVAHDMLHNSYPNDENWEEDVLTIHSAVPTAIQCSQNESVSQMTGTPPFTNIQRSCDDEFSLEWMKHELVKCDDMIMHKVNGRCKQRTRRGTCRICKVDTKRSPFYCKECTESTHLGCFWICDRNKYPECYNLHKELVRQKMAVASAQQLFPHNLRESV